MYKIIREAGKCVTPNKYARGDYRILNTDNNILNKHVFKTMGNAKDAVEALNKHKQTNKSKAGQKRTEKHNQYLLELYKAGNLTK